MAAAAALGDGVRLRAFLCLLLLAAAPAAQANDEHGRTYFVVIGGLGGEAVYREMFAGQVNELRDVFVETAGDESLVHSLSGDGATRDAIEELFRSLREEMTEEDRLALFLIGHGTFDGRDYRFNLPGPDITGTRLGELLDALPAKLQLVVNTSSASGAMLERIEAEGRIVAAATKSGGERNATAFGRFLTDALEDPEADTDKNETITAAEAFRYAASKVEDFYESQKRLATEHPRLSGEMAGSFVLARLGVAREVFEHPALAPHFRERDRLYREIDELKLRKESLDEEAYYDRLEELLVQVARAEQKIEEGLPEERDE